MAQFYATQGSLSSSEACADVTQRIRSQMHSTD